MFCVHLTFINRILAANSLMPSLTCLMLGAAGGGGGASEGFSSEELAGDPLLESIILKRVIGVGGRPGGG